MKQLMQAIDALDVDSLTKKEIVRAVVDKLAVVEKIRGQIGHDLRRRGENAFLDNRAYNELEKKYIRAHQSRKKLELLELDRRKWVRSDTVAS